MMTISPSPLFDATPRSPRERGPRAFAACHGSIVGREHRRLSKNNQDAVGLSRSDGWLVAVVADGCGSGAHTEVGAQLGAAWLAGWIPHHLGADGDPADPALIERWTSGLLAYLAALHRSLLPPRLLPPRLGREPRDPDQDPLFHLRQMLLFGFLVAIIGREKSAVIGLGDGLLSVNGDVLVIDPGPENAPPYLAYRLAGDVFDGQGRALDASVFTRPLLHWSGATSNLDSLVIATDGAAELLGGTEPATELRHFELAPRYLSNPSLLQKRLRVVGELEGRLADDTTLVLLRRIAGPGSLCAAVAEVSR